MALRWCGQVVLLGILLAALPGRALAQPASRWVLQTDILGGYQSNVYYTVPPRGDYSTRLAARLLYRFDVERVRFGLIAGVGTNLYAELDEYNQVTWEGGLLAAWDFSRRTAADARISTSFGYGGQYGGGLEDVTIPPATLRRRDAGGASLHHRFSRTLDGRLEAHGERYDFGRSDLLRDGWRAKASAALERSRSKDSVLSAIAEYERTATKGQEWEIERLLAGWREPIVRQVVVGLTGGVARYRPVDPGLSLDPAGLTSEPTFTPTGGAEVTGRFGDHTVSVRLARSVGQMFGLGAIGVSRIFDVDYSFAVSSRLVVNATAADNRLLEGTTSSLLPPHAQSIGAGLRYAVTRRLDARLNYSYWRRGDDFDELGRHTVWVGVRRDFSWR